MRGVHTSPTVNPPKTNPLETPSLVSRYWVLLAAPTSKCRVLACALLAASTGMAADPGGRTITLEQAYDRTLATDQSIQIACTEVRKANLLPWSALTRFGPRLNAGYSANHSETNIYTDYTGLTVNNAQNASIILNQPLIDFTFFPAYRLGKLTVNSNRLQYQFTIRNVLFGVAKAYYDVLKQEKIVAGDKITMDLAENQLKLSQNQYNAGAVSRVDVLRAESTLESARQSLIADGNILENARNTLANTLNLQGKERDFQVVQPADASEHVRPFDEELAQAYANREDYKVSRIAIQQNKEVRNQVIGEYAPTVSAQLAKNWNTSSISPRSDAWAALVSVQLPIFTGGQREIDLRTAGYNVDESKVNFETTQKNVESDVKLSWLQVENLRETIVSVRAQVEANAQNYQDLQNQYKAGVATSLDTQIALIALANTNTTLITEIYQYQVALRDLERAVAAFQNARVKNAKIP